MAKYDGLNGMNQLIGIHQFSIKLEPHFQLLKSKNILISLQILKLEFNIYIFGRGGSYFEFFKWVRITRRILDFNSGLNWGARISSAFLESIFFSENSFATL
jgi:hypothetical protein